ncbi:MAG: hypothetical protein GY739_17790 [Mesoflavibacter sp.]|nr:hypothetical protein [Mesoflavibacter sp.]
MEAKDGANIFQKYYNDWLNDEQRNKNAYEYERSFVEMMQKFEKEIFQHNMGDIPINRNVKKKYKRVLEK